MQFECSFWLACLAFCHRCLAVIWGSPQHKQSCSWSFNYLFSEIPFWTTSRQCLLRAIVSPGSFWENGHCNPDIAVSPPNTSHPEFMLHSREECSPLLVKVLVGQKYLVQQRILIKIATPAPLPNKGLLLCELKALTGPKAVFPHSSLIISCQANRLSKHEKAHIKNNHNLNKYINS